MTKKHIEPFLIDESSISVELSHFSSFLCLHSTIKLGLCEYIQINWFVIAQNWLSQVLINLNSI